MSHSATATQSAATSSSTTSIVRTILPAAAAAAVLAAVTHLIFKAAEANFLVTMAGDDTTVGTGRAAFMGGLVTLLGGTIAFLIARRTSNPVRTFTALVVLGLVPMFAMRLTSADQTRTVLALEVMHVVVAGAVLAIVLPQLRKEGAAK